MYGGNNNTTNAPLHISIHSSDSVPNWSEFSYKNLTVNHRYFIEFSKTTIEAMVTPYETKCKVYGIVEKPITELEKIAEFTQSRSDCIAICMKDKRSCNRNNVTDKCVDATMFLMRKTMFLNGSSFMCNLKNCSNQTNNYTQAEAFDICIKNCPRGCKEAIYDYNVYLENEKLKEGTIEFFIVHKSASDLMLIYSLRCPGNSICRVLVVCLVVGWACLSSPSTRG